MVRDRSGRESSALDELADAEQRAIIAMVGKLVTLVGYDEDGRAELEFEVSNIWRKNFSACPRSRSPTAARVPRRSQ